MTVKIDDDLLYSNLLFNDKGEFQLPPYYDDYSSSFWQYYYAKDLDGDGDSDLILSFGDVAENRETEVFYRPVILENMGDGTLVLFKGRNSLHRVTQVKSDHARILVTLNFNTEPGIMLSKLARMTFFGRLE